MRTFLFTAAFAMLLPFQQFAQPVTPSIYETPRMMVFGEGSIQVDADVIICLLNIYDLTYAYDYENPVDPAKQKADQMLMIEKLGCKDYMTNPQYSNLKSYMGTGPYELKFSSKAQYEQMMAKAQTLSNEKYAVSIEYSSSDISQDKKQQLKSQMLDKALSDAKSKAEKMAKSLGVLLGLPIYVEEQEVYPPYGGYESDTYSYNPTMMVTVSSRVQIQYELKR